MTQITKRQREVLEKQDAETLCRWHTLINSWQWPEGLPDDPYRGLPPDERARVEFHNSSPLGKTSVFLFWIEDRVSKKKVLHHWNVAERKVGRMTEAEFEKWWKEEGGEE